MASTRNTRPVAGGRRRLTARSVLASTLLGLNPPELSARALVGGAELLGVTPGTARVAISRMVAAGELEPTADGYRLAGHLLQRQARQDLSRSGARARWNGTWRTAIVPGEARSAAQRTDLRRAMTTLRYGELRDGVWLRPDNLPPGALAAAEAVAAHQTIAVVGTVADEHAVTARLWDLGGWAADAGALLAELTPLQTRLDRHDSSALADGFVVAAAVLRHLQADPLLPARLLPATWPGDELRSAQGRFDASFKAVLGDWHRARGGT
ncbi:PaaX family transcriptional regulator C-terminal domain-containing protein [Aquihabitans sp. McL0605]|uniref:PaaX family transcriptional regulator C-terminal domain-containing protein n=1 Tax=Aquihabitans sp. McL0605 TaxID=3415671 RepID=UPI003CF33F0C